MCPRVTHSDFCVSPNGEYLVIGSDNGALIVLNLKNQTFALEEIYEEHNSGVRGVTWLPGKTPSFASIDSTGGLYLWK